MKKLIELPPIHEGTENWERIEKRIKDLFRKQLYLPMFALLKVKPSAVIKNAPTSDALGEAIMFGKVYYSDGAFRGKFNAQISLQLRGIGATWENKSKSYRIPFSKVPPTFKAAISVSKARFEENMKKLDAMLVKFDPKAFTQQLKTADLFDKELFNVDKKFRANVKKITIEPELEPEQRTIIAKEWETNMDLWVQRFTEEQIVSLRKMVQDNVYAGNRQENLHAPIKAMLLKIDKHWVNVEKKAAFLARQETNLLLAKFKQVRYEEVGMTHYKWACVHMPKQPRPTSPYIPGEVRYSHGILDGSTQAWSRPPIITSPLDKKQRHGNPGQDYNCRCFAIPLLEVDEEL